MINDKSISKLIKVLLVLIIITVAMYLITQYNIFSHFLSLLQTLIPFFIAFFISWLMKPVGNFLHEKLHIKLTIANLIAVFINLLIIFGFIFVFLPIFGAQLLGLIDMREEMWTNIINNANMLFNDNKELITSTMKDLEGIVTQNADQLNLSEIGKYLVTIAKNVSFSLVSGLFSFIMSFISIITQIIVAYVISFYFINHIQGFSTKTLKFLLGSKYETSKPIILKVSITLLNYLKGLLLDCFILGTIVTVGCWLLGIPSPIFFGIVAGVFNVIPYIGPVIAGIPIFIAGLSVSWFVALMSIILMFGAQIVESNFIQPRIMKKVININPVSTILGLLIFGSLFGLIGMIITVPILAVINVLLINSKYDIHL